MFGLRFDVRRSGVWCVGFRASRVSAVLCSWYRPLFLRS